MKPEEAIAIIETEKSCIEKSTKGQCSINCGECKENVPIAYKMKSYDMAIEALKEVQLYHLIKDVTIGEIAEVLKEFSEIGTVEECREAVEKQKPKAPKDSLKIKPVIDENGAYVDADVTVYLLCPNCGEMVGIEDNCDRFCRECGQAIDENLEGMEDE